MQRPRRSRPTLLAAFCGLPAVDPRGFAVADLAAFAAAFGALVAAGFDDFVPARFERFGCEAPTASVAALSAPRASG